MGDLEQSRRLAVHRHVGGVNGGNRAGKADRRHAFERDGDGMDAPVIERELLNLLFGERRPRQGQSQNEQVNEGLHI